jgi:hypothetical protein
VAVTLPLGASASEATRAGVASFGAPAGAPAWLGPRTAQTIRCTATSSSWWLAAGSLAAVSNNAGAVCYMLAYST